MPFKKLGQLLRELRESNGLLLREVALQLQIDPSMLSKIELGDKKPTKEHILQLAKIYHFDEKQLLVNFLSEKVMYELDGEELAIEALKAAEEKIKNYKNKNL
jgi:HTH-type transcriptional regulator, competence development regulator